MESMLKKYVKRFLREEPSDKYYEDKDFLVGNARSMAKNAGEKKYRPKRAASSRAMETVHKAMLSDEEVCIISGQVWVTFILFDISLVGEPQLQ